MIAHHLIRHVAGSAATVLAGGMLVTGCVSGQSSSTSSAQENPRPPNGGATVPPPGTATLRIIAPRPGGEINLFRPDPITYGVSGIQIGPSSGYRLRMRDVRHGEAGYTIDLPISRSTGSVNLPGDKLHLPGHHEQLLFALVGPDNAVVPGPRATVTISNIDIHGPK